MIIYSIQCQFSSIKTWQRFNALHIFESRKQEMYSVTHKRKIGIQVGCAAVDRKEIGVQCSHSIGSYGRRKNETGHLTYDELLRNHL